MFLSIVFLLTVACLGCGLAKETTYPVQGVVRFPDGKVLRGGWIEFESSGRDNPVTARGVVGPDGSFVLGTFTENDGAVPGEHRVIVMSNYQIGTGAERPGMIPQETLHPRFGDFGTSRLTETVKEGDNTLLIEVDYKSSPESEDE